MKIPQQINAAHYSLPASSRLKPWMIVVLIFAGLFIAAFIEYSIDPNADKPYRVEQPNVIDPGASAWAR